MSGAARDPSLCPAPGPGRGLHAPLAADLRALRRAVPGRARGDPGGPRSPARPGRRQRRPGGADAVRARRGSTARSSPTASTTVRPVAPRPQSYRLDLPPAGPALPSPEGHQRPRRSPALISAKAGYSATRFQRDSFPERFRPKIEVHFDGVDDRLYAPGPRPREIAGRSVPEGTKVVTFVARGLESVRGFDLFLAVAGVVVRRSELQRPLRRRGRRWGLLRLGPLPRRGRPAPRDWSYDRKTGRSTRRGSSSLQARSARGSWPWSPCGGATCTCISRCRSSPRGRCSTPSRRAWSSSGPMSSPSARSSSRG